jgi:hypothetical protein
MIDNLSRELDLLKSEKNENINLLQNKFKDKFAIFNMRKAVSKSKFII